MPRRSPFKVMFMFFAGLGASAAYGVLGTCLIWYVEGQTEAVKFFTAYTSTFRTIISFGLILGTALVVFYAQKDMPDMIEDIFTPKQLKGTNYFTERGHFWNPRKTILFTAEVTVVAFIIFRVCQFPLTQTGDILMMIAVCAEYAFASFVGRKLRYAGMMIDSLREIKTTRNLFKNRDLDAINWYVNVASTLTIIFVYVHIMCYYQGPFEYNTWLGKGVQIFLILPAIMATPVLLIFNFYPREVIRTLYSRSINNHIKQVQSVLKTETLSPFEERSYVIELEKMSRDELRYGLQQALTDLPIGITIIAMVIQTLLTR